MKQNRPSIRGFLQALGLTVYVALFASIINLLEASKWQPKFAPGFSIMFFLLAFIFSAVVCGALMLGYPITLFSAGKRREAFIVIAWSAGWLVVMGAILLLLLLLI
ncbi:MAG: hypothetical protein V1846_05615 [Candidatus Komeilibacteria bacterium]